MNKLVLAVVATFNPQVELVAQVQQLISEGVPVLIVDDASVDSSSLEVLRSCEALGARLVKKAVNGGIGQSLNMALQHAAEMDAEYLLTLDQDTALSEGYVEEAVKFFQDASSGGVRVGLVTAGRLNGKERTPRYMVEKTNIPQGIDVMQSGCLISVEPAVEVGGFREEFVMDCVDVDFCLRLRAAGYHNLWNDNAEIHHALGRMSRATILGRDVVLRGRTLHISNHSDDRRYYMTRNRWVLWTEYRKSDAEWGAKAPAAFLKETLLAVLFEPKRLRRLFTILEGLRDAVRGRLGRRRSAPNR